MEQSNIENNLPENPSSTEGEVLAQTGQAEMTDSHQNDQSTAKSSPQNQSSSETSKVESSAQVASIPGSSSQLPSAAESSNINGPASKKPRLDYHTMSAGVYLDSTVVPILHLALVTLDRVRPEDPVQFVIDFLLSNKAKYSKSLEQPVSGTSVNQA